MREILFRGKRVDNGEWVEGYYAAEPYTKNTYNYGYILENEKDLFAKKAWLVDSRTVGQFTGLTNKNGTKVFEGDIVAIPPNMSRKSTLGVVKFGDYKTPPYGVDKTNRGFYIRWYYENEAIEEMLRRDIVFWFNYSHVDISIIGNIYDNPELLEVE